MKPSYTRLFAVPCARRSAWSCPRASYVAGRLQTAPRISLPQSRCFESSAIRRDGETSTVPSEKLFHPLGFIKSNIHEIMPIAAKLIKTPIVKQIKNPTISEVFSRKQLNVLVIKVRVGGKAMDKAISILVRPFYSAKDKTSFPEQILSIRAALIADKVLGVLQQHLPVPGTTILSDEERTLVEDFVRALDTTLLVKDTKLRQVDKPLVDLVVSLRKDLKIKAVKSLHAEFFPREENAISQSEDEEATPQLVEQKSTPPSAEQTATTKSAEETTTSKPAEQPITSKPAE